MRRLLLFVALLGFLGYGALTFLQWHFKIGEFAKGPQQFTFTRYERKVVGGGRAGLEYFGLEAGKLHFKLHCLEGSQTVAKTVWLENDERSAKTCGVYVHVLEVKGSDGYSTKVEVSWD